MSKLLALFVTTLLLVAPFATTHAEFRFTITPGNNCRAALESQDGAFRVFNDKFKNQSTGNVFAICPITWPGPRDILAGGSTQVGLRLYNERLATVDITCNAYAYVIGVGTPDLQAAVTRTVASGQLEFVNIVFGSSSSPAWDVNRVNIVCLLPGNTSIVYYFAVDGDYYEP